MGNITEGADVGGKKRILILNALFKIPVSYLRGCLKMTVEHISLELRREVWVGDLNL